MTPAEQRAVALRRANARRIELAGLRRMARQDPTLIAAWLLDPPAALADVAVVDVVRLPSDRSTAGARVTIERLGRLAARDGINLFVRLGRASTRTRTWVAEHAVWRVGPTGRIRLRVEDGRS